MAHTTTFGAFPSANGVHFAVWAPDHDKVDLVLFDKDGKTESKRVALQKDERGVFQGDAKEASVGSRYKYVIDGQGPFPDPASRFQPEGVHGASMVVDHSSFKWSDQSWKGVPSLEKVVIYELHVGTFTQEGTYKALQAKLPYLKNELGVTAIELLPLADCPGKWNWGYDGVALYAPNRAYGSTDELKDLVNAAHAIGLAVIIDLVYNHMGPDGNYLGCYNSHYFTQKHNTPWGAALNYDLTTATDASDKSKTDDAGKDVSKADNKEDAAHARLVRAFVIDNAVSWVRDYHFDGARLDATHAIVDYSKPHVLQEMVAKCTTAAEGRNIYFFAEDDRNETELVTRESGIHSLWADDFHHQVRVCVAGDNESYFANFTGSTKDMAETIRGGWFYSGQAVPSSGEKRGTKPEAIKELAHFCNCIQNHDQIGNRAMGERLNHQITSGLYKTASALLLLVPETPMLFQGQEWASSSPFQFFTDHNEELGKLVTAGRRREFSKFKAFNDPETREKIPDPQAESTFQNSKLKWDEVQQKDHGAVFRLYQALLKIRLTEPAMGDSKRESVDVQALDDSTLLLVRKGSPSIVVIFRLKEGEGAIDLSKTSVSGKTFDVVLTTEDDTFKTSDSKGKAPSVDGNQVKFSCAAAIVLRAK